MNSANTRDIAINAMYEGFANDGMFSSISYNNRTYTTYIPPAGCIYTGPYKYDSRCRQWFLEPINRVQVTPIEPQLFFDSPNNPSLASNLCKRQQQYVYSSNGTFSGVGCGGYSVNCITFKLSFIKQFFETVGFKNSKTIMIDPRSQKVVYNSISGMPKSITYLSAAIKDIFPLDNTKQGEFLKAIQSKIPRQRFKNPEPNFDQAATTTTSNGSGGVQCNYDVMETQKKLLRLPLVDYKQYSEIVNQINFADPEFLKAQHNAKSFVFKASDGEELFVAINAIVIIEKFREIAGNNVDNSSNNGVFFELQDLFLVIDILPKKLLTTWTDKLIRQIQQYLLYFGIAAIVMCVVFLSVTGVISYKVCLMIEVPIVHMTDLLKIFQEEGEGEQEGRIEGKRSIVLSLIEEQAVFQDEMIFLSLDIKILFESLRCIFRMVHLATQDIFTVDSSHSLLQLNYQINFFRQFRNTRVLGICYNNIGNIHFQNKRYLESMENYQQALIFANYEQGIYAEEGLNGVSSNSYAADVILDVIFSRKLNFSFALYMHNVSQKVKDNNGKAAKLKMEQIFSTKLIDWEVYERVLLQLIEINRQFTEFSYGRSVILCCQLSACYLKMNQLEKAIQFQGQAIADYEVTLMMEDIRKKNTKLCDDEEIMSSASKSPQIGFIRIRESTGKDKEMMNSNRQNSCFRDDSRRDFLTEQLETRRISYEKAGVFVLEEEKERISKISQFQIKQESISNTNRCSAYSNSKYTKTEKNNQQQQKLEGQIFRSIIKKRTKLVIQNGCKLMGIDDSVDGYLNLNKNKMELSNENSSCKRYTKEESIRSCLSKQATFRSNGISVQSKLTTSQHKIPTTKGQMSQCPGNIDPNRSIKLSQDLRTSSKSYGGIIGSARDIQNNQMKSRKSIKSPNLQPMNNRVISLSAYHRPQQSLSITTQQPIAQYDYLKRQKIQCSSYKSMVNKNLLEEDLQQIQRFELPNDVLLQKISIQEARILISEKKYYEASLVLTELLEKTKFYLPFDRLKNLSILEEILLCFEVNASPMRKMISRFDEDIMFSVSTVLAVKKEHSKAANTCVYLVNEVLTNEHDKYSLMIYSQNNFEQAIPSVEIKQIRAMKELISEIIEDLSGGNQNNSNEDITYSNNSSRNHSIYQENNGNIDPNRKEISFVGCMSPNFIINRSRKLPSQEDVQLQQMSPSMIEKQKSPKNKNISLNGIYDQLINSAQLSRISKDNPLIRRCFTHFYKSEETKQKDLLDNAFDPALSDTPILQPFPLSFSEYPQQTPTKIKNEECNNCKHEMNQVILLPTSQTSPFSQIQQTSVTDDSLAEISQSHFSVSQSPQTAKIRNSQFFLNCKISSTQVGSPRIIEDLPGNIDSLMAYTSQDCIDSLRSEEDKQNNKLNCLVNSEESQGCFDDGLLSPETQAQDIKVSVDGQEYKLPIIQEKQQILQTVINEEDSPEQIKNMKQELFMEKQKQTQQQQHISAQINSSSQQQRCEKDSFKCSTSNQYSHFPLGSIKLFQSEKVIKLRKQSTSAETSASNLSKENINFVFHFALRKAILGYFGQDPGQFHIQKRLTELNSTNKSRKFILFITDQTGIVANNKAYGMLTRLLYQAQIQLLVLQLQFEESLEEKNEISDCFIENKPVIKYFYTQEKMLQYIRNKREPMKNFGIPLLVEHFQV